ADDPGPQRRRAGPQPGGRARHTVAGGLRHDRVGLDSVVLGEPRAPRLQAAVLAVRRRRARHHRPARSPLMASDEERGRFREIFRSFPTGVAVITATGPSGPVGMSANAVCSLSLDPLLVLVCFDVTARTLPVVRDAGRFAVNMLRDDQRELSRTFASKMPEQEKFAGVGHREEAGVPVLDESLAWVICDVQQLLPVGDHEIAIGAVQSMSDVSGEPLVFFRGGYRALA